MDRLSYLFVDESGHSGIGAPDDIYGQYLCLLGCAVLRTPYWKEVHAKYDDLKGHHFPRHLTKPVVLHRADILRRNGPFSVLRDPDRCAAFDADLLQLYEDLPYTLIGVVVDKLAHERYAQRFYGDPYHWALALLLERYCGLVKLWKCWGRVICEARGPHPDRLLQRAYQQVYDRGTPHHRHPASFFQTCLHSRKIKFMGKDQAVAGLELADGLVRASKTEILADNGITDPVDTQFAIAVEKAIASKWNRRRLNGQVPGYGKVFFTLPGSQ